MKKEIAILSTAAMLLAFGAGCSDKNENVKGSEKPTEEQQKVADPVMLTVFQNNISITDQEFNDFIVEPVKKKYPNISLQLIREGNGTKKEDLLAAGSFPDIILSGHGQIPTFNSLGLIGDLNDLVKSQQFDLTIFESYIVDEIKKYGEKGELYALPFSENFSAMFYNKHLFDTYGVTYPKDQMTWDQVMDLAKSLATKSSGNIIAINAGDITQYATPLSLPFVDPKTKKAVLATSEWRKVFDSLKAFHDLPGNTYIGAGEAAKAFGEERIGMLAAMGARLGELEKLYTDGSKLNWDLVSYPSFPEAPGKRRAADIHILGVSAISKKKEAAFQAITAIYSKEAQLAMTRKGRLSSLKDADLKKQFASELKSTAGKNIAGIFKATPAPSIPLTEYNDLTKAKLANAFTKFQNGETDANTALREAEELSNQDIAAGKLK